MVKKKAQQKHATMRFLERGLTDFSKSTNELFCKYIRTGENVKFIRKTSNRVTVWDIHYEDKIYRCVYDKTRKQIVTLLNVKCKKSVPEKPATVISTVFHRSEPVMKYGVKWKSEGHLKRYEERLKQRYEKDYEKWIGIKNV